MSNFVIGEKEENGGLFLDFSGKIDEDASFNLINVSTAQTIFLDLENVSAINSCGIRGWINWIESVSSTTEIIYRNCTKVVVDQINMVAGFLPDNGRVESFYVPYYSEESEEKKMVLFKLGVEFSANNLTLPDKVIDSNGAEMELDVIEAKYFKFLK